MTTYQTNAIKKMFNSLTRQMAEARWAAVANNPASFGMLRMLAVHLEASPVDMRVFRSIQEAEQWLDSPRQ